MGRVAAVGCSGGQQKLAEMGGRRRRGGWCVMQVQDRLLRGTKRDLVSAGAGAGCRTIQDDGAGHTG